MINNELKELHLFLLNLTNKYISSKVYEETLLNDNLKLSLLYDRLYNNEDISAIYAIEQKFDIDINLYNQIINYATELTKKLSISKDGIDISLFNSRYYQRYPNINIYEFDKQILQYIINSLTKTVISLNTYNDMMSIHNNNPLLLFKTETKLENCKVSQTVLDTFKNLDYNCFRNRFQLLIDNLLIYPNLFVNDIKINLINSNIEYNPSIYYKDIYNFKFALKNDIGYELLFMWYCYLFSLIQKIIPSITFKINIINSNKQIASYPVTERTYIKQRKKFISLRNKYKYCKDHGFLQPYEFLTKSISL